jgi:two-component sensor histidine kinase
MDQPRLPPRWLSFLSLWLLFTIVWASQLYIGGYVKPWSKAFGQEALYWLSWGIVAPLVFWLCRRLQRGRRAWTRYAVGLLLGAIAIALIQTALLKSIAFAESWLEWRLSLSQTKPSPYLATLHLSAIKAAGGSLTVYAAIVLAWHAAASYREARDRKLKSLELESLLHQARLDALRSQLNPHFLFNTLHSIAELTHENPKLAEQLILRLGELLRRVLASSAQQETTLADEVEFVRSYLEIEQMRLGDRLEIQWDIAPETLHAMVPGMILQPLVENAIQHGIAPLKRPGKLSIKAYSENGSLHLQLRDSGPGLNQAARSHHAGIGLSNTESRLQRLYGQRQHFELRNNDGLEVNVRLPFTPGPATGVSNETSRSGS